MIKPRQTAEYQAVGEKAHAFEAFRAAIPPEIVRLVEPFPSHQWNMMVFLQYSKEARDLAVSNQVLAYALANNADIRGTSECLTIYHAMRNVRKKQREICESLGFPGTEAIVRLLRKIPAESCSPPTLRILRMALRRSAEVLTCLGHLRQIHPTVIYMVSRDDVFDLVTPRFLLQTAEAGDSPDTTHVADMLFNIVYHASRMRRPPKLPKFVSPRSVEDFHDRLILEMEAEQARIVQARQQLREAHRQQALARRRQAAVPRKARIPKVFPPPPLPGTEHIVPITTLADLRLEGRQQHHCVGSYAHRVASNRFYVYRVLHPQRATLSIEKGPSGDWRIGQLKRACNKDVSIETCAAVMNWLDRYNVSL